MTLAGYSLKEKYSYISRMLKCKQELKRLLLSKIFTALLYGWYCLSCILGVSFTWLITCKCQYSILLNHTCQVIIVDIYLKNYEFLSICSGETVLFDWWVTKELSALLNSVLKIDVTTRKKNWSGSNLPLPNSIFKSKFAEIVQCYRSSMLFF